MLALWIPLGWVFSLTVAVGAGKWIKGVSGGS